MLPFSVVGPFVSPILDRFDRRRTVIVCDLARLGLAITTAVAVAAGLVVGRWQVLLYALLLVILSLNRLQLAALGAGMPYTVRPNEYLAAASVMPMIGPLSGIVGGLLAGGVRLASGRLLSGGWVDGLVFLIAAGMFGVAVVLCAGYAPRSLGPRAGQSRAGWGQVWSGLVAAGRGLASVRPAWLGVAMVFGTKVGYGVLTTLIIVLYRHHFGAGLGVEAVLLSLGGWFLVSGAGYALSGLVATPVSAQIGVRRTILLAFVLAALVQSLPGALLTPPALLVTGFVVGLGIQSVKICADTIVQAHIPDAVRGRVMVLYDIVNNLGLGCRRPGRSVAAARRWPLRVGDGRASGWFALLAFGFAWAAETSRLPTIAARCATRVGEASRRIRPDAAVRPCLRS